MIFALLAIKFLIAKYFYKLNYINYNQYLAAKWFIGLLFLLLIFGAKALLLVIILLIIFNIIGKQQIFGPRPQPSNFQTHYSNNGMNKDEALKILGITTSNPSRQEINNAYKQMMNKFHPDKGGSDYFAIKINQAKQILLKDL
ncbi:DnaJ domain-containing protein [Rickettsiales endosymbiont of Stachyamoeba lipophora]|uniref:DnaJ domain-containing protein n=1 Tax=Rickettsiales endosymbiont of Stachyamoeba lipophora TaxID=2486578 RepID=UPI001F49E90C|nr:DnaJ domain-containing protein [Rickettsiales endosymbiont of Stachyamoeba lipophora]